jgi:hypothetical protein
MYKYMYIKLKFQILFQVWLMSGNGLLLGARPNFYKIVSSKIKLNFLNLMISSKLFMGWRLLAVSVSFF